MYRSLSTCAIAAIAAAGLTGAASAAPMTVSYSADFSSPTESFWGPGNSAASFGFNQMLFGNTTFGMRFTTGASSGTVSSYYRGNVFVGYDDTVDMGPVNLQIGYQGDPSGGHFQTAFGAFARATVYFPSPIPDGNIVDLDYSLDTARTYAPSPPDGNSDSDSFTPASTAFGPDVPVVGAATAGIDYDIVQNATHTVSGLTGTLRAINQRTGAETTSAFSLGSLDDVSLNLVDWGVWDVELTGLSLANSFSTDFDLDLVAFAQYRLGDNCGDLGTDDDNNVNFPFFGCVSDGRLDRTLATVDLFTNTPFALALTTSNLFAPFSIEVAQPTQVAVFEPATLTLFGAGLAGLGLMRRRLRAAS